MKFFKHFTDAADGTSMMALMNEHGHAGYACYFILMEMCASKLEKNRDAVLTEEHCNFRFNRRQVELKLRLRWTRVQLLFNSCSTRNLFTWTRNGDEINLHVPKLLECLHRDNIRARPVRGQCAAGSSLDKDKDKDKDIPRQKNHTQSVRKNEPDTNEFELAQCIGAWAETLEKHRINKDAKLDEFNILKILKAHGFEKTRLALIGAGYEEKSEKYNPSKHIRITRLFKSENFENFINLGAQVTGPENEIRQVVVVL